MNYPQEFDDNGEPASLDLFMRLQLESLNMPLEINEKNLADALICWFDSLDLEWDGQHFSLTLIRLFLGDDPDWRVELVHKRPGPQRDMFVASKEWERNDEIRAFMQQRLNSGEKHEAVLTDAIEKFKLSRSTILKRVALSKASDDYTAEIDAKNAARMQRERWLGLSEQSRAIAKWSVCRFHAAASSGWLK